MERERRVHQADHEVTRRGSLLPGKSPEHPAENLRGKEGLAHEEDDDGQPEDGDDPVERVDPEAREGVPDGCGEIVQGLP